MIIKITQFIIMNKIMIILNFRKHLYFFHIFDVNDYERNINLQANNFINKQSIIILDNY
jgi:hypothetical protein